MKTHDELQHLLQQRIRDRRNLKRLGDRDKLLQCQVDIQVLEQILAQWSEEKVAA